MNEHIVTLSDDTLQRIDGIAAFRQWQKRGEGITNQKISTKDPLTIEKEGMWGEFVVAKYYGVEPNLATVPDGGIDLWVNGTSIDVKYTAFNGGDLFFTTRDHFKAEIGILVEKRSQNDFELKGWVERERFLKECLYHAPHKSGQRFKSWMGVGMTQPNALPRDCPKCDYHYAPINKMKERE